MDDVRVTTWLAVAQVLGISHDTLIRRRKRHGDRTGRSPWFRDHEEVIAWYRALTAPPPAPEAKRPRRRRETGAPLDVAAKRRELDR